MRMRALMLALCFTSGILQAAEPLEPVTARLDGIDPPSREFTADGVTFALSSTAAVSIPGITRASLRDLQVGMNVRLALASTNSEVPVVNSITVLPE